MIERRYCEQLMAVCDMRFQCELMRCVKIKVNNKWIIVKFLKLILGELSWKKRIELVIIARQSIKGKNKN